MNLSMHRRPAEPLTHSPLVKSPPRSSLKRSRTALKGTTNRLVMTMSSTKPRLRRQRKDHPAAGPCHTTRQDLYDLSAGLNKLYLCRCEELNIPVLEEQKARFLEHIGKMLRLRRLDLREAGLSVLSSMAIGQVISNSNEIAYVNVSKNALRDKGISAIMRSLQANSSVVYLNVSANGITPLGAEQMFISLKDNTTLYSLNVGSTEGSNRNRLGRLGAERIRDLLKRNNSLAILNLSGTWLGPEGLESIFEGLEGNEGLFSINLSSNGISVQNSLRLTQALSLSRIIDLNLEDNSIGNEGCNHFANLFMGFLKTQQPLQRVNLSNNSISASGAGRLFLSLTKNTSLRYLNLTGNSLLHFPFEDLLQLLISNSTLEYLNLSQCKVSNGLHVLAEGLSKNKGLSVLKLNRNTIGNAGVTAIALGLRNNTALKSLDLSANLIKTLGGVRIVESLKANTRLQKLNLKDNRLKDAAGHSLVGLTRLNKRILRIDVSLNPINITILQELKEQLARNVGQFNKNQIPVLRSSIKKLLVDESLGKMLSNRIEMKDREIKALKVKCQEQAQKLDSIKTIERVKYAELHEQRIGLEKQHRRLNKQLYLAENLILNRTKANERMVRDLRERNAQVSAKIFEKEMQSKGQLGSSLLRKDKGVKALQKDMAAEEAELSAAKRKLKELRELLERKKNEVRKY